MSLQRSSNKSAKPADNQTSGEWLEHHSIEAMNLTLKHLMEKGQIGKLVDSVLNWFS